MLKKLKFFLIENGFLLFMILFAAVCVFGMYCSVSHTSDLINECVKDGNPKYYCEGILIGR